MISHTSHDAGLVQSRHVQIRVCSNEPIRAVVGQLDPGLCSAYMATARFLIYFKEVFTVEREHVFRKNVECLAEKMGSRGSSMVAFNQNAPRYI